MDLEELRQKREERLKKLVALSGWVIGSVVETEQKDNGKTRPFRYLSHSKKGRNSITYISEKQLPEFHKAAESGMQARILIEEVSDLTAKIIKLENKRK